MHPVDQLAERLFKSERNPNPEALPFQRQVYDLLEQNRNIVLQAPTGSGKTFAALAPFALGAWGRSEGSAAKKLLYSLPLRVLAGALRKEYESVLKYSSHPIHFTNQFGGSAEDPFLDGGDAFWSPANDQDHKDATTKHAIFTTIDQTLSGFIGVPVGVSNRQANMLYGSILSGALVFDEFHLLRSDSQSKGYSFGTALHLLGKSPWPFMIMTATMSTGLQSLICDRFNAVNVQVGEDDLPNIRSQYGTVKHLQIYQKTITGNDVLNHLGKRTLVICNTVNQAQKVYEEVQSAIRGNSSAPTCILLHSRFLPSHRAEKENEVTHLFKEGSSESAILIATQVVEAGLNISCDVMHTEISPIDSFLQRIGRAARFSSEREAFVHVYPPEDLTKTKPYSSKLVHDTLDALAERTKLEYQDLQSLIDPILEKQQCIDFENYWNQKQSFDKKIHQVRWDLDYSANKELVRDINSAEIVIAEPNQITNNQASPWEYPAISVPQGSIWKYRNDGGLIYAIKEIEDEIGQGRSKFFQLEPLGQSKTFALTRFIIPPSSAFYSQELGLRLGIPGEFTFSPESVNNIHVKYGSYEEEPYHLHIRRIYDQASIRTAAIDTLKRLQWPGKNGQLVKLSNPEAVVDLMIWGHDLAKLSDGWQKAHGDKPIPLAHGGRVSTPPHHALEGAVIVGNLLKAILTEDDAAKAVFLAICTHHSSHYDPIARAQELRAFKISEPRIKYLKQHIEATGTSMQKEIIANWPRLNWKYDGKGIRLPIPDASFDPLYSLLIYTMRRCDTLATSLVSNKEEDTVQPPLSNNKVHIVSNFI